MNRRSALALACLLLIPATLGAVVPGTPQDLSVNVSGNTVTLAWNAPSTGGAPTGYVINASLSPGGSLVASLPVSNTSVLLNDVPNGVYYVHVRAVNIDGTSGPSNEIIVAVPSGSGGCTSRPNAPTNPAATVAGNLVTLSWSAPLGGCAATTYAVQAGSAAGLSDIAVLNVGAATSLSVSAPSGTYYVRIVAMNAFGGSVGSVEIVVTVGSLSGEPIVIGFEGLSATTNGTPIARYTESGFTLTPTAQEWVSFVTLGNPAPFIQFDRPASQPTQVGEITVTAAGQLFRFQSIDLYSHSTSIPYEMIGLRNGVPVTATSGTVPNPSGGFATVANPQSTQEIDTLLIRIANPATPCCNNPVGLDNLILAR